MVKALEGRVTLGAGRSMAEVRRGKERRRERDGGKCMVWSDCWDSWSMLVMYVVVMRVQMIADDGLIVGFSLEASGWLRVRVSF